MRESESSCHDGNNCFLINIVCSIKFPKARQLRWNQQIHHTNSMGAVPVLLFDSNSWLVTNPLYKPHWVLRMHAPFIGFPHCSYPKSSQCCTLSCCPVHIFATHKRIVLPATSLNTNLHGTLNQVWGDGNHQFLFVKVDLSLCSKACLTPIQRQTRDTHCNSNSGGNGNHRFGCNVASTQVVFLGKLERARGLGGWEIDRTGRIEMGMRIEEMKRTGKIREIERTRRFRENEMTGQIRESEGAGKIRGSEGTVRAQDKLKYCTWVLLRQPATLKSNLCEWRLVGWDRCKAIDTQLEPYQRFCETVTWKPALQKNATEVRSEFIKMSKCKQTCVQKLIKILNNLTMSLFTCVSVTNTVVKR